MKFKIVMMAALIAVLFYQCNPTNKLYTTEEYLMIMQTVKITRAKITVTKVRVNMTITKPTLQLAHGAALYIAEQQNVKTT